MAEGEIPAKEYDYLLSMPIWSLTEERVDDLEKQLKDKNREFNELQKLHIFELWTRDLDKFLKALDEYEAKEEADRCAVKNAMNNGKRNKKNKKKPITKKSISPSNNQKKQKLPKGQKTLEDIKAKDKEFKVPLNKKKAEVPEEELPLIQRL